MGSALPVANDLFAGIAADGIVIVAVSGGSDSMALLLLANAWAASHDVTLHAVTVDHGLRPEAAAEAAFVASVCDGLGIDHTTLAWEGIKPHSGIAFAARRARYTLIEEFAAEIGATAIMTGHTADDQAETVQMRLARSGGDYEDTGRGLAGMATCCIMPGGCELFRPLLATRRADLRNYLASFPQNWIEDPTNHDESFERVRVRARLAGDPVATDRLIGFADAMGGFRSVLSHDAAQLLSATIASEPGGVLLFDYAVAEAAPRLVLIHAFQAILAVAGGGEYLVPRRKIEDLITDLDGFRFQRTTLGNSIVERTGDSLRFYRENRGLPTIRIDSDETALWDGRLLITNNNPHSIRIGPATRDQIHEIEDRRDMRFKAHPRAALLSCGLITGSGGEQWLATAEPKKRIKQVSVRQTARAIEYFCPNTDFPLLDWLRRLEKARVASLQSR